MSKDTSMALAKLKNSFTRQPHPQMFSRIVSVLSTSVDRDTLKSWPAQKRLAGHVGCNEKTVKRNLEAARNLGILTKESVSGEELKQRTGSKKRLPPHHRFMIYTINMDHPLWQGDEAAVRGVIHLKNRQLTLNLDYSSVSRFSSQISRRNHGFPVPPPWQNGYAESFHSRLCDEFLAHEEFENLAAALQLTTAWQTDYNHHRPHSSLGYDTPAKFAAHHGESPVATRCSSSVRPTAS